MADMGNSGGMLSAFTAALRYRDSKRLGGKDWQVMLPTVKVPAVEQLEQDIEQAIGRDAARHLLRFLEVMEGTDETVRLLRVTQPDGTTVLALSLTDAVRFATSHQLQCQVDHDVHASFDAWWVMCGQDEDKLGRCA